jgi:hypothetical protein
VSNPSTCLNISESSLQLMTSIFAETQRHRLHHNRTPYRSNFLNEQKYSNSTEPLRIFVNQLAFDAMGG